MTASSSGQTKWKMLTCISLFLTLRNIREALCTSDYSADIWENDVHGWKRTGGMSLSLEARKWDQKCLVTPESCQTACSLQHVITYCRWIKKESQIEKNTGTRGWHAHLFCYIFFLSSAYFSDCMSRTKLPAILMEEKNQYPLKAFH